MLVVSFDVRGAYHRDGENSRERRAPLNVKVIERCGPTWIGCQELQDGNLRTYEAELPGYECVLGPRYENSDPHSYNAIYGDPTCLELLDTGGFW